MGRKSTFTPEQEQCMAEEIKVLGKLFYGLSPQQVRRSAFDHAENNKMANKIKDQFWH